MYYLTETRITPLAAIRRERLLPVRGDVLVRPGEQVGPADVIARCQLPSGTEVIDVSRVLGLPRDRVTRLIRKAAGDAVQVNEVLAAQSGLLGRLRPSCRSPVSGEIVAIRDGMVLIEAEPANFELYAHLKGQIANVMPGFGVVIATTAVLIQGLWGTGGEAEGVLKVLVDSPGKLLRARAIDVSCHGTIVVGGSGLDEKALDQAVEAKVKGLVIGSIGADLRARLQDLPYPVIITEGFGSYPMSDAAFALLQANAGREAMIDATTQVRWGARRPEIIIPIRSDEGPPAEAAGPVTLQPGMRVRALRAPYLGVVGTVVGLPGRAQVMESGSRLPVAEVAPAEAPPLLIPVANLELIR